LLDMANAPEGFLDPVARVVEAALAVTEELSAREVMVVGACCRDILHSALGHSFATAATRDRSVRARRER
jgi:predicted nucleotidyltransferase